MKYRKLYERIVDDLVADGVVAEPLTDFRRERAVAEQARMDTVTASLALNRVYALCYDDAPVALSVVSQVAREFGVKLDIGDARELAVADDRWREGATAAFRNLLAAYADAIEEGGPERLPGFRAFVEQVARTIGVILSDDAPAPGRKVSAPAAFAARMATGPNREDQAVALRKVLDVLDRWGAIARPEPIVLPEEQVRDLVEQAACELGVTL